MRPAPQHDSIVPDPNAFWNVNVDPGQRTVECPDYLRYCLQNDKDRQIIGTPDSAYTRLTWEQVKAHVANNRPDLFQRTPSELRKYRHFCQRLEGRYGNVIEFIMKERLKWEDACSKSDAFEEDNYKILFNDWPYGIDELIVHLIVWTKFNMAEDPKTGLLVPEMQQKVDAFVDETFVKACGRDKVAWFRNWTSLKSVHAVEHIHVMLFDPERDFIDALTGGDCPLAVKLGYIRRSRGLERNTL